MIKPLKALGQHFLNRPEIATSIATALSNDGSYEMVLEIGPGTGVLTSALMEADVKELYCIEIDERSVIHLAEHFPQLRNRIIQGDFLHASFDFTANRDFAVIGNFPYNISSQILFRVLENYSRIPEVVGMFQKEVALRIASPPGNKNYGILSVLLQAHYDIEYLFSVPASAFIPPPKVESGVIRMKLRKDHLLPCNASQFKNIVKTAFNQRRKMIRNSLKSFLPTDTSSIPFLDMRPEQLHFSQFVELTNLLHPKN